MQELTRKTIARVKSLGFGIVFFDGKPYIKTESGEMTLDLFNAIYDSIKEDN